MTEADVTRDAQRFWDRYSGYQETDVRKGEFRNLVIGDTFTQVVAALTELSVYAINPLPDVRRATNARELKTLRDADAIRLGPGSAVFRFKNDAVVDSLVGYDLANHNQARSAANRDEVFEWLATIVDATPHNVVTAFDPTAKPMFLPANGEEIERFRRFTTWETDFKDDEGYWGLRLHFVNSKLVQIKTRFSRLEPL